MRHRSNIAFILLAAALFAAPQMSHDLSTLKDAVAARIRGEILQAFLGLHSNESSAAVETQAPRADATLAACSAAKTVAQPAQAAQKKGVERAVPSQRDDARAQSAMLTDPTDKTNAGIPPAAVAVELSSLPQILTESRLAMLTPPGNGVEPPPSFAYNYTDDARRKAAPAPGLDKFAELERHAVYVQARFERGADGAEWVRRIAEEAVRAAGSEGAKGKARVIKVRRMGRACDGDNNVPCAPVPVASLAKPDAATQIFDGE